MYEKLKKTQAQVEYKTHGYINFYVNIMGNILHHEKCTYIVW